MPQVKITTKGTFSGVSLSAMRNYLKFEDTNATEDTLITSMIEAAVERVEKYCNIKLRTCSLEVIYDAYEVNEETAGGIVTLPIVPCRSVTKVYIIDEYGTETEETSYYSKGSQVKDIICPSWIDGYGIKVTYDAGYGTPQEAIPEMALQVIYKLVGRMYEMRTSEEPLSGEERKDLNQISYAPWI